MNGCSDCRGSGIALYKLIQADARRFSVVVCASCGGEWDVVDGLVVFREKGVQAFGEVAERGRHV